MRVSLRQRFDAKVDRSAGPDGCHIWTGAKSSRGYGQLGVAGHMEQAHRIALLLEHGTWHPDLYAVHACDRPECVNAKHLRWGTPLENSNDARERNRLARGTRNGRSRLTEDDVLRIRELVAQGQAQNEVARRFGVAQGTVNDLVNRRSWAHLPGGVTEPTRKYRRRFTADEVREIRRLAADGIPQRVLAERFAASRPSICQVVNGVTWAHLPDAS